MADLSLFLLQLEEICPWHVLFFQEVFKKTDNLSVDRGQRLFSAIEGPRVFRGRAILIREDFASAFNVIFTGSGVIWAAATVLGVALCLDHLRVGPAVLLQRTSSLFEWLTDSDLRLVNTFMGEDIGRITTRDDWNAGSPSQIDFVISSSSLVCVDTQTCVGKFSLRSAGAWAEVLTSVGSSCTAGLEAWTYME